MFRRTVSAIMLILILTSMLPLAFNIQPVGANGTIYIRADGSVDPPTAPVQRNGDVYTLTGNITTEADGIVVSRYGLRYGILMAQAGQQSVIKTQVV